MDLFKKQENGNWLGPDREIVTKSAALRHLRKHFHPSAGFRENNDGTTVLYWRGTGATQLDICKLEGPHHARPLMALQFVYDSLGKKLTYENKRICIREKEEENAKHD